MLIFKNILNLSMIIKKKISLKSLLTQYYKPTFSSLIIKGYFKSYNWTTDRFNVLFFNLS